MPRSRRRSIDQLEPSIFDRCDGGLAGLPSSAADLHDIGEVGIDLQAESWRDRDHASVHDSDPLHHSGPTNFSTRTSMHPGAGSVRSRPPVRGASITVSRRSAASSDAGAKLRSCRSSVRR
jgi:hypothetical protein